MKMVSVYPAENGWEVRSDAVDNHQLFASGAHAEVAARRLAEAIAHGGEDVSVQVHLRGGELAGTRMVWAGSALRSGRGWSANALGEVSEAGPNGKAT